MSIPQELLEQLQRGNVVLFLGPDLPAELTGLPSRADLATALAERLGLTGPLPSWPEMAARYKAQAGLRALIAWLREQLEPTGRRPGPIYALLAQLPITTFITTAYDVWLHQALEGRGRHPNLPVVGAGGLGLLDAGRPTVVQLFGVRDRPESLVLTADEMRQLPQTKSQLLMGLVQPALAHKTVLILGQDLRDAHFQTLYQSALFQAGTIPPLSYAIWRGLEAWEQQTWRERGVHVIEAPEMEVLGELLNALGTPIAVDVQKLPAVEPQMAEGPVWNTEVIRQLLTEAFSDGELTTLCFDHFRPVYKDFGGGMGKGDKIQKLLDYCDRQAKLVTLVSLIEARNPAQYARFAPRLRR